MDFESYVQEARRPLLRFAIVLTDDPELAQDVVQDVLLKAHRRWATISELGHPHAYVRRMLANEVISWRRKWARVRPSADGLDQVLADPTDEIDRRDVLLRELARLPIKQRAAVVMRYLEDMPDTDIAEVLGCSAGTVRVHVHRALTSLRVEHAARTVFALDA